MNDIKFPVSFEFNISTIANDFTARDAQGNVIAYAKQKMFKLKEDINIYNDQTKSKINYNIKADRWLDFSAVYAFFDQNGKPLGKIARKGWRSIWKADYEIIDNAQQVEYTISEENPWIKVLDNLIGEIPILNFFTGYLFHPSYIVTTKEKKVVFRLKKVPSFFGRKFDLSKVEANGSESNERIMLGLMMMVLLERRRG